MQPELKFRGNLANKDFGTTGFVEILDGVSINILSRILPKSSGLEKVNKLESPQNY